MRASKILRFHVFSTIDIVSVCYFIFGIAAVGGGALGGTLSDWIGTKKSILMVIIAFVVVLGILPFTTFSLVLFIPVMIIWAALSWALAPPQQSFLIQAAPATSDIQQSFNNSALQVGIAVGSAMGGIALEQTGTVAQMPWVGSIVTVIALLCAVYSLSKTKSRRQNSSLQEHKDGSHSRQAKHNTLK